MTKTILITGAGSGFGLGTARKLHAQNHRVIGVCQTEEQVSHLTQEGIEAVQVDITNPASVLEQIK
jgi:NADP-dependent 3-hydroxy acid dehydrogenase YdfG